MGIPHNRPFLKLVRATHKDLIQPHLAVVQELSSRRPLLLARKRNAGHIALVHGADRTSAIPGDTVIFTAWITNDSPSYLQDVSLIPRSFTNEGMESLRYTTEPLEQDLRIGLMAPGQSVMRSFSYLVTDSDQNHGGSLVSAMQVRASCRSQVISDEHDAAVSFVGTRRDWPVKPARRGQLRRRARVIGQSALG
ncbi:hypothetical protein [Paenarthrobacter nitroguajacolicus]|uniref:hypothetical protein n=1 Tax=Paenarthrobacter nitroguajacolicus TaxID=211146 RepID=UPI004053A83B